MSLSSKIREKKLFRTLEGIGLISGIVALKAINSIYETGKHVVYHIRGIYHYEVDNEPLRHYKRID